MTEYLIKISEEKEAFLEQLLNELGYDYTKLFSMEEEEDEFEKDQDEYFTDTDET